VVGDARLTLAASPQLYDLIVLDAFSSDAIPVHLLTREAVAGYMSRLTPQGALVIHISNRHMDLAPVVAAVGAAEGLAVLVKEDRKANQVSVDYKANSIVAVLARNAADAGDLPAAAGWRGITPTPGVAAWTDDYSDILGAILRAKFRR
jgi:spermidine synthase